MTRLFLDTEFNGHAGELISIALVADDGSETYAVCGIPADPDPWVAEHVLPLVDVEAIGSDRAREQVVAFVRQFENPTIICDFPTDLEHFFRLMRGPSFDVSYWNDMRVEMSQSPRDPTPDRPHNALSDARALRDAWA
jgi:hypothetical protein